VQKIVPFLWYDGNAEQAVELYVSLFQDGKILSIQRLENTGPKRDSQAKVIHFQLAGQQFIALDGGPQFKFTEAMSLYVNCETQAEVDRLWERLSEGGQKSQCGWLKDRFGVSWQIIPTALQELLGSKDPARAARVLEAMLKMTKLDIAALESA
jgi:predicted 3-demethylubiquinone-9 3-methyltransferase (glyoxalase superfamily)